MALFDDFGKAAASPGGLVAGIGALILAPIVAPAVRDGLRPAAKAVLRAGITAYRSTLEPVRHTFQELVTEAQLELGSASAGSADAAEEHDKRRPAKRRDRGQA